MTGMSKSRVAFHLPYWGGRDRITWPLFIYPPPDPLPKEGELVVGGWTKVWGVECRDVDCFVLRPILVECPVKGSGKGRGIADQQQSGPTRGHRAFDGFEDVFVDSRCFVDYEEDVFFVEALEAFGGVGGESHREVVWAEFEAGTGYFGGGREKVGVLEVDAPDFSPEEVCDLSLGWRGGNGEG